MERIMPELTPGKIMGLVLMGIVILIAVVNKLFFLARQKDESIYPANLEGYLLVMRKGWQIVLKNIWLFWILIGVFIFSVLERGFFLIFFFLKNNPGSHVPYISGPAYFSWATYPKYLIEVFFNSFLTLHFNFNFLPGDELNIFLLIFIVVMMRPFRKFLSRDFLPELQPSINYIRKNFWPVIIISFLLLFAKVFLMNPGSLITHHKSFRYLSSYLFPFHLYLSSVFISIAAGFIILLFERTFTETEFNKKTLFVESLKFFKPLFLINVVMSVFIVIAFWFLRIIPGVPVGRMWETAILNGFFVWLVRVMFLFVPYFIVIGGFGWKDGLKNNFLFWKKRFLQTFTFVFIITLVFWMSGFLVRALTPFSNSFLMLGPELIRTVIDSLVVFWVLAAAAVFYLGNKRREIFDITPEMQSGE